MRDLLIDCGMDPDGPVDLYSLFAAYIFTGAGLAQQLKALGQALDVNGENTAVLYRGVQLLHTRALLSAVPLEVGRDPRCVQVVEYEERPDRFKWEIFQAGAEEWKRLSRLLEQKNQALLLQVNRLGRVLQAHGGGPPHSIFTFCHLMAPSLVITELSPQREAGRVTDADWKTIRAYYGFIYGAFSQLVPLGVRRRLGAS